jgi:uncharacterized protein YdaU (DUF1376 family)
MSRTKIWMPLYVADYLADTTRLSTEQHGAYLLLIMDYWRNGPLPNDDKTLAKITKLSLRSWRLNRAIIEPLFVVKDGVWRHKRIDQELAEAAQNAARHEERARVAAEKRWEKHRSKHASSIASSTPQAVLEECPSPSPSPSPSESEESQTPPMGLLPGVEPALDGPVDVGIKGIVYPEPFESFWAVYPRKEGKKAAYRAWQVAKKLVEQPALLAAVDRYAKACKGKDPRYIAHPTTWLNQGRWDDQPTGAAQAAPGYVPMAANGG